MRSVVGNRLFDQHMFASGEESACNFVVSARRGCYRSGVNHPHEIIERFSRCSPEFACNRAAPERLHVMHCCELNQRNLRVESCVITSDMSNANNTNAQLFHRSPNESTPKAFMGQRP